MYGNTKGIPFIFESLQYYKYFDFYRYFGIEISTQLCSQITQSKESVPKEHGLLSVYFVGMCY